MLDHIRPNLNRPLRLDELAELAGLSAFHFHRVFQALMGETPNEYVKRLRLDKSLKLMSFGKPQSLTTIALDCGFSSSSDFTRSFKQRFGVAPSKFDCRAWRAKHGEQMGNGQLPIEPAKLDKYLPRSNPDQFRVRIRELPARQVAYIRVANPYQSDAVPQAAKRLIAWAEERKWDRAHWLGYQFENPEVTPLEQCQYCVAVEAEGPFTPRGEVGRFHFPPMLVAEVAMRGDIDLEMRLLRWLYGSWLPRSRYVPDDQPCFEAWAGKPFALGYEFFDLAIHLPVRSIG